MPLALTGAIAFVRRYPALIGLIATVIAVAVIALLLINHGVRKERARQEAARAVAVAEAIKSDEHADAKSTASVQRDAERIAEAREELIDAIAQAPDSLPDAASVVYGCRELQRHGISTADLPACSPARR